MLSKGPCQENKDKLQTGENICKSQIEDYGDSKLTGIRANNPVRKWKAEMKRC